MPRYRFRRSSTVLPRARLACTPASLEGSWTGALQPLGPHLCVLGRPRRPAGGPRRGPWCSPYARPRLWRRWCIRASAGRRPPRRAGVCSACHRERHRRARRACARRLPCARRAAANVRAPPSPSSCPCVPRRTRCAAPARRWRCPGAVARQRLSQVLRGPRRGVVSAQARPPAPLLRRCCAGRGLSAGSGWLPLAGLVGGPARGSAMRAGPDRLDRWSPRPLSHPSPQKCGQCGGMFGAQCAR